MPSDGKRVLAAFDTIDAILAREEGGHPTAPPMRESIAQFLLSGKRRGVWRKGRQSGWSTSMVRVAVAIAKGGKHSTPPGTRGEISFISVRKADALERLHNAEHVLQAIEEPYCRVGDIIELLKRPIIFRSIACNSGSVRGQTRLALFEDEMASWRNDTDGANPAADVDGAAVPALITQENGRVFGGSSPLGHGDFHAKLIARGNTPEQIVFEGPTWYWAPHISEASTRALEPHEPKWMNEFAAVPRTGAIQALNPAHFDACVVGDDASVRLVSRPTLITDLSMGGGDAATWWLVAWAHVQHALKRTWTWNDAGEPIALPEDHAPPELRLYAWSFGAVEGKFRDQLRAEELVARIARDGVAVNARHAVGDQLAAWFAEGEFRRQGIKYESIAWTNPRKVDAVATVRRWMRDRTLAIADGRHIEGMRAEVAAFAEKITANGSFKYEGAGGVHDDRVALILGAAMAEAEGLIDGSPHRLRNRKHEIHDYDDDNADEAA